MSRTHFANARTANARTATALASAVALGSLLAPELAHAEAPLANEVTATEPALSASEGRDSPTLFDSKPSHNAYNIYFAPSFGATTLNHHLAADIGIRGAYLLDEHWGVGLAAHAMGWDGRDGPNPTLDDRRQIGAAYGGLLLEYRLFPRSVVHGLFDATVGGGVVCTDDGRDDEECQGRRGFMMLESTSNVEVSLTHYLRVSVGAGYRLAFAPEHDGISGDELGGYVVRSNVALGWF
jgi:hypothetical protein